MSWCSAFLIDVRPVCSKTLSIRPSTSGESNWELHTYRWTSFKTLTVSLLWDWRSKKSYGQLKWNWLCLLSKRRCIRPKTDFYGLKVSQGKVRTLSRWGGKLNHLSLAYLLSNNCTKNYWNLTTTVQIRVKEWVAYSFRNTMYMNICPLFENPTSYTKLSVVVRGESSHGHWYQVQVVGARLTPRRPRLSTRHHHEDTCMRRAHRLTELALFLFGEEISSSYDWFRNL